MKNKHKLEFFTILLETDGLTDKQMRTPIKSYIDYCARLDNSFTSYTNVPSKLNFGCFAN